MRRTIVSAVSAAALLVGAAIAYGAPSNGDAVTGGGKTAADIFNFAAHSGPNGEDARGHAQAREIPGSALAFDVEFEVTCLRVVGNRATVAGPTTKYEADPPYPQPPIGYVIQFVEDNGNQQGAPDRVSNQFVSATQPLNACPAPGLTPFPLTQGNIVVRDR